ncbi:MAG TPA: FAD-dependent oxidoreductase [Candidatus Binataceae bacterium]|nr:FAD-dependent oxidoreductase [Candidatus Binataceae bacterium]
MRIGILGGGLVGLVIASRCSRHQCEILELDDKVGGHCRSLAQDGYTFDLGGPHILFSRNKPILELMYRQLEDNVAQRRRNNRIWYDGRFVKYPFENGLYDLAPQDRFECLYHYLKNDHPKPANFKEWIYHVFGDGIAEKYMIPYNEKIWNVPAEEMAIDWVEGRVPRPPVEDVMKSAVGVETEGYTHQLYFGYPKIGGIEALPLSFAKDCRYPITTGFRVQRVWREAGCWNVTDGQRIRSYDALVSTIPIQDLIDALPDVPAYVSDAVRDLRYNSLIVVMIGAVGSALPCTALYVPDPSLLFHRLSFPQSFTEHGAPPGHMAITAEITTNPGDGIHELGDDDVLRKVVAGLETMGLLRAADLRFSRIHRTKHAYVVRTFDYSDKLKLALDYLNGLGIISAGRNAEFEYINMDEAVRRGLEVAKALDARCSAGPQRNLEDCGPGSKQAR